ncbi:MAG: spore coat protein CotJB [Clostridiales bacterium]|nr:spore coat protein CotJB [Clostridiales bacterium]
MNCKMSTEQENMLHNIGVVDFVTVEMTEYLDTHPSDREAMEYFNHYMRMKNQMMRDYANKYGPLSLSVADTSSKEWKWALQPMPWEGGC